MKQVLIKKGKAMVEDVPSPILERNKVLVKVLYSCISSGTEMATVQNSGTSLVKRAMQQPENVKKVLDMIREQGAVKTFGKVKGQLDTGTPTGYSAVGEVIEVGADIKDIVKGQLLACAGAGYANHAEYISVPRNLCMRVPEGLDTRYASTVTLGGIALQGVRRADMRLGETCVVYGMGILGQITLQLLKASGCHVICIDIDERRLAIARENGADIVINSMKNDTVSEVMNFTEHNGADSVIVTASANNESLISNSFNLCKRKGRVVMVGVAGDTVKRSDMYKKELDYLISTSYGPGRYDTSYEEEGNDYPFAYVRWTENRNMEEYLRMIAQGEINIAPLVEKEYDISAAGSAYDDIKHSEQKPLVVLLKYDNARDIEQTRTVEIKDAKKHKKDILNVAIAGAGGFAKGMHLPNLAALKNKYNIHAVMSRTGSNAASIARQYGASYATTDYERVINDENVDLVIICTRHDKHASMALEALERGKAVMVEKPMATNKTDLEKISAFLNISKAPYMVGFNRRFSKYAKEAYTHILKRVNPMMINYRMNAGYIPLDHWVHTDEGGGRIIGEACHIIDLFSFFTNSYIESLSVNGIDPKTSDVSKKDNVSVTLKYQDGSVCNLVYSALGNKQFPKEYCEIHYDRKTIVIDDYKKIHGYGVHVKNIETKKSEKGQYEELLALHEAIISGENYPIPIRQIEDVTRATLLINGEQ